MILFRSSSLLVNGLRKKTALIHSFVYCIPKPRKNRFILVFGDICPKEGIKSLIRGSIYGVPLALMLHPLKKNRGQAHALLSSFITFYHFFMTTICIILAVGRDLKWDIFFILNTTKKLFKRSEKHCSCLVHHPFVSFGMLTCLN